MELAGGTALNDGVEVASAGEAGGDGRALAFGDGLMVAVRTTARVGIRVRVGVEIRRGRKYVAVGVGVDDEAAVGVFVGVPVGVFVGLTLTGRPARWRIAIETYAARHRCAPGRLFAGETSMTIWEGGQPRCRHKCSNPVRRRLGSAATSRHSLGRGEA